MIRPKFNKAVDEIIQKINTGTLGNGNNVIDTNEELAELGKYLNGEKSVNFELNNAEKTAFRRIYERAKENVSKITGKDNSDKTATEQQIVPEPSPDDAIEANDGTNLNPYETNRELKPDPKPSHDYAIDNKNFNPDETVNEQKTDPNPNNDSSKKLPDGSIIRKEIGPDRQIRYAREYPDGRKEYYDSSGKKIR